MREQRGAGRFFLNTPRPSPSHVVLLEAESWAKGGDEFRTGVWGSTANFARP